MESPFSCNRFTPIVSEPTLDYFIISEGSNARPATNQVRKLPRTTQTHRKIAIMSSEPEDFVEEDNLFGDDDEAGTPAARELSDRELDSGDDEERDDRARQDEEVLPEQGEARVMDAYVVPHPIPSPTDGEVSVLSFQRKHQLTRSSFIPYASLNSLKYKQTHSTPTHSSRRFQMLNLNQHTPQLLLRSDTERIQPQTLSKAMHSSTNGATAQQPLALATLSTS